jgi:hypothetical protein
MPIWAISPAAWIVVLTSSGPLGGAVGSRGGDGGGGGGDGRAARRCAFSVVAAREAAVERVAFGLGFGLAAAAGFAALRDAVAREAVPRDALVPVRRPIRSGRVDGRLASTPSSVAADFLLFFAFVGLSLIRGMDRATGHAVQSVPPVR